MCWLWVWINYIYKYISLYFIYCLMSATVSERLGINYDVLNDQDQQFSYSYNEVTEQWNKVTKTSTIHISEVPGLRAALDAAVVACKDEINN